MSAPGPQENDLVETWLEAHALGYGGLTKDERTTIKDFVMLWSLFEVSALDAKGSANKILKAVESLHASGRLDLPPFAGPMVYFFSRYHNGADFTAHFPHLNLRKNDHPTLVKEVLLQQRTDDVSKLAALLIIVYRLRNNFLHGEKWNYGLGGQLDNFRNARAVLMTYMERY